MVRIRILQLYYDCVDCVVLGRLGFLVAGHDFCFECNDDNVRLPHGSHKPENGENKLVSLHSRKHFRVHTLGCALRILRCRHPIHGPRPSNLRLHDTVHLLLHVQHLRNQHDSAVQGRWTLERLPVRRKILHHTKFRSKINPSLASIHRNIRTILKLYKLQKTEAKSPSFLISEKNKIHAD
jgi:hypothetical protein